MLLPTMLQELKAKLNQHLQLEKEITWSMLIELTSLLSIVLLMENTKLQLNITSNSSPSTLKMVQHGQPLVIVTYLLKICRSLSMHIKEHFTV